MYNFYYYIYFKIIKLKKRNLEFLCPLAMYLNEHQIGINNYYKWRDTNFAKKQDVFIYLAHICYAGLQNFR